MRYVCSGRKKFPSRQEIENGTGKSDYGDTENDQERLCVRDGIVEPAELSCREERVVKFPESQCLSRYLSDGLEKGNRIGIGR